jgi:hypothetical protein
LNITTLTEVFKVSNFNGVLENVLWNEPKYESKLFGVILHEM